MKELEDDVDYGRFERLVLGLGSAVIVASMFLTRTTLIPQEVAAQLLIIAVLGGAVHWGRNGGFVIAVAATLAYLLMRVPLLSEAGLTSATFTMVLTRMATYGTVGILGGEACGRLKYLLTHVGENAVLDEVTMVYNARFIGRAIRNDVLRFQRYQTLTSVVLVKLAPALLGRSRKKDARTLRAVATHLRTNVRVIDDVGYIRAGEFSVLLGQTPRTGAEVTADRVRRGVRDLLGAQDTAVAVTVLTLPDDMDALLALAGQLSPEAVVTEPDAHAVQAAQGAQERSGS